MIACSYCRYFYDEYTNTQVLDLINGSQDPWHISLAHQTNRFDAKAECSIPIEYYLSRLVIGCASIDEADEPETGSLTAQVQFGSGLNSFARCDGAADQPVLTIRLASVRSRA